MTFTAKHRLMNLKSAAAYAALIKVPLLAALLSAAGCGGGTSVPNGGSPDPRFVGVWDTSASGTEYYNPNSGWRSPAGGSERHFEFTSNGSYKHFSGLQTNVYSCSTTIFGYEEGTYAVEGNMLHLHPDQKTLSSTDTCNPEWNYEKPGTTPPTDYHFSFVADDGGGSALQLTWPDGTVETLPKR